MGKATGFLDYARQDDRIVPVSERILTFDEFHTPLDEEARIEQAGRCMNCGVPFCQSAMKLNGMVTGCPLHNLIPEWNDQIWQGHMGHAYARLSKTSNFPEFTGRVCPALCEKACICGEHSDPVSVHDNERFLIEEAFARGYVQPMIPKVRSGMKIAVVGSGPSGLAAADMLNHRGHTVHVYEREDRIGGLLMYGIPNMKLDKSVITRRQKLMEEEGVVFFTGCNIDEHESDSLKAEYDAVILCCGAKQARKLKGADPEKIKGIYYAVDYLTSVTKSILASGDHSGRIWIDGMAQPGAGTASPSAAAQEHRYGAGTGKADNVCKIISEKKPVEKTRGRKDPISAFGKHVVVVGGGDTGNDCIGTAIRQGCASVTALEMMPMPPAVRREDNPWPQWPKVLKTDYGHEEAIALWGQDPRVYETTVKEYITGRGGRLKQIVTVRVRFEDGKLKEVPGSEQTLRCDILLIAAGFTGCEAYTPQAFGVEQTSRGCVRTEAGRYQTSVPGIFTAGDMHRGQSLVVWAIAEGRAAAAEVDRYLMGYERQ